MKTVLLSNIPHYHYLAQALERGGRLQRYITTMTPVDDGKPPLWLSGYWRKKLEGRRLTGVPKDKIRQIWLAEILQKGLPRTGLISQQRGFWINNHLFDAMAAPLVGSPECFHFVSSVGLYCARKAKRSGAKIICDVRQEHPYFQRRVLSEEDARFGGKSQIPGLLYEQKVVDEFALADYLIVPSTHAKRTFLAEGFSSERVFVLPYGVEAAQFPRVPRTDQTFRVLYVGQITLRKGIPYLLEAFSRLKLPNSELLLIGPVHEAMRPILGKYEGVFRHIPALPKIELYRYYSNASLYALPSMADAFPLAVLEAMISGLPVVISENTGSSDVVRDGEEGFVVPVRDPAAIAERIQFLYENPERREAMGRAAEAAGRSLTWKRYGDAASAIYEKIETLHAHPSPTAA